MLTRDCNLISPAEEALDKKTAIAEGLAQLKYSLEVLRAAANEFLGHDHAESDVHDSAASSAPAFGT